MFLSSAERRILAYSEPVDMRKSFNGLVALVQGVLQEDPLSGCLFAKRLERGRFCLPSGERKQEISEQAFRLILDGIVLGRRRQMR